MLFRSFESIFVSFAPGLIADQPVVFEVFVSFQQHFGVLDVYKRQVYLNHLLTIILSVFLRGYRGKTVDFQEVSHCHRTTTAYFLNHGKWKMCIRDSLWGVPLIALMILTGLYFTVRSGFFQFRHFGWIMKRTGGKLFQKEKEASEGKGMLSSFEAISTAIGGTVGFGNIAGVATAVAAGGPGAIMWMWLSSLLGMILKQVEVTLGCYYRHTNEKMFIRDRESEC